MRMPRNPLFRLLLEHLIYGTAAAVTVLGGILYSDFAGIRTMAFASDQTWLWILLLFFGLWVTLGSVAMGIGVMRVKDVDTDPHP